MLESKSETAILAGGCFWCTEAIFKRLKGVISVMPGYTGGTPSADGSNPTYEQVCSGKTGHAESIQIEFDPSVITYAKLLEIFFHLHDPTSLNRQGNDSGTQYRSAIFYMNDEQKKITEELIKKLEQSGEIKGKIVTTLEPFTQFYEAESYHQDYYAKNSYQPYCQYVIDPKLQKLLKEYGSYVKN